MSAPSSPVPAGPWCETPETVLARLQSDAEAGLTVEQAAARLARHGRNELRRIARRGIAAVLWDQFATPIVALLVVAATLAFAFGERLEGLAIVAVIVLNAALGFVTELRALASMEALRRLGSARTRVRRGGREEEVDAETLVPGDLVILDAGDRITADLRLVSGSRLQADESALTGESMPVAKDATAVDASAALPERSSMLYKGTALTRGSGEAVVVGTGMETELGHISALVARAEAETTPLERRLRSLAHRLIGVTLLVGALVAVAMLVSGREPFLALELAIALAVAAIPEGLPIVATIALARGMWRMARRNVLIERLGAVETLGSTTVVLVDKTGTLTENRMTVVTLELACGAVRVEGTGLAPEGAFRLDGRVV
ncbi:MAG: HAD-IC family P-type ATPase, partial [Pseudomonadales bacterium]|nr:HAD-IC family P-type ATPase [Pseudomonadales bacterium]